jgi:hypothetical protein
MHYSNLLTHFQNPIVCDMRRGADSEDATCIFAWILGVLHDALLLILARAMTECCRMLQHVARLRRMMIPQLRDACHGPVLVPSHTNPELTVELRPLSHRGRISR